MRMPRGLVALASIATAAASLVTVGDARGELGGLQGLRAPRLLTASFATLQSMESTWGGDVPLGRTDPELRARHDYAVLAALPAPQSASVTFDVRPVLEVVVGRRLKLGDNVEVVSLRGVQVLVADFGKGTTLGLSPNGFGLAQGGVFSFRSSF